MNILKIRLPLNEHAPIKEKYVRANNPPFMNKTLSKAVMTRSRLRNRYLKKPMLLIGTLIKSIVISAFVSLRRKRKTIMKMLISISLQKISLFGKLLNPYSLRRFHNNITLMENEEIISRDPQVAEILNTYFSNIVKDLDIERYKVDDDLLFTKDHISNITAKYKDHPSILKIKENVVNYKKFSFSLNVNKPSTFNNIPTKILVDTSDISSPFLTKMYNDSILHKFTSSLKLADVTPVHKKDDRADKSNYRPVSIVSAVS